MVAVEYFKDIGLFVDNYGVSSDLSTSLYILLDFEVVIGIL